MRINNFIVAALALTGCKWTEFDDLEGQAWVGSTEKPDTNSSDYGIAVARGLNVSSDGGTLVVIGAGQALYTELLYKAAGSAALDGKTEIKLNSQYGIGNLAQQPVLITDYATDDVALVTNSGAMGSIALLQGTHTMTSSQVFGPSTPTAAVYMKVASQMATDKPSKILVAADDAVYGFAPSGSPQPKCNLVDEDTTTAVKVNGLAVVHDMVTGLDDLLVWGSEGKLYIYDGDVFDGTAGAACTTGTATPISKPVDVAFKPDVNSTIQIFDGHFAMLAAHAPTGDTAIVAIYDIANMNADPKLEPKLIGTPLQRDGMKAATILSAQGKNYVIGGFPFAAVDGVVAGQVLAFDLDTATVGITATPVATLNDAQPEGNQQFGRALTTFQFNDKSILAVTANNEVFAYYQSPLYGETRR